MPVSNSFKQKKPAFAINGTVTFFVCCEAGKETDRCMGPHETTDVAMRFLGLKRLTARGVQSGQGRLAPDDTILKSSEAE
jgi:hypothetical protein